MSTISFKWKIYRTKSPFVLPFCFLARWKKRTKGWTIFKSISVVEKINILTFKNIDNLLVNIFEWVHYENKFTKVLHMCFGRFLLAFVSRDLSQADKRITRASSFPSFNFFNDKFQLYSKTLVGTLAKLFWSIYHSKVSKLKK